jgi:PTS system cellobiose-specific IIB component
MVTKMRKAAEEKKLDVSVDAFPEAEISKHLDEADVVLLGPQIRYALKRDQALCDAKKIPIAIINSIDYGMMRGDKVLAFALNLLEETKKE